MIPQANVPIAYTLKDAAAAVGMSEGFLRAEMRAKRLGHKYVGRRISIPHEALQSWYDSISSGPRKT